MLKNMRTERAGLATKLLILSLLVAACLGLISVRGKLTSAQEELDALRRQVEAQTGINAALNESIANSGSAESDSDIARARLGLVEPDERVFVDTNH